MGEREGEKAKEGLRYFNEILTRQPFLTGEIYSMADITLLAGLAFAEVAGIVPSGLDALTQWQARMADLPAVKNRSGQNFLPEDLKRLGF
jgi:glutathione S-transferase